MITAWKLLFQILKKKKIQLDWKFKKIDVAFLLLSTVPKRSLGKKIELYLLLYYSFSDHFVCHGHWFTVLLLTFCVSFYIVYILHICIYTLTWKYMYIEIVIYVYVYTVYNYIYIKINWYFYRNKSFELLILIIQLHWWF